MTTPTQGEHAQTEALDDLYLKLHGMSKHLESSGRIDESDAPEAYPAILDAMNLVRRLQSEAGQVPAPTSQPAPATQQAGEVRPVTPYTCPKCHALWLHWPAEQTGFGRDTLNCRSADHCHYCEKAGVEQLQRLERIPAALHAPQPSPTAQPAPAATDPAYSEACSLATALFEKHYRQEPDYASGRVVWSLCDTTAGVISQIDNMVSGLARAPAAGAVAGWLPVHFNGCGFYGAPLKTEAEANQYIEQVHQSSDSVTLIARPFAWVAAPTPAAQADSQPALAVKPACWIPPECEGEYHRPGESITAYREPMEGWEPVYREARAQADSVLEDAAPSVEATAKALAWLELPMHVRQTMRIRAEATLTAARKQGAKHD